MHLRVKVAEQNVMRRKTNSLIMYSKGAARRARIKGCYARIDGWHRYLSRSPNLSIQSYSC